MSIGEIRVRTPRAILMGEIEEIAKRYNVSLADVLGPDRFKQYVIPRHEAMAHIARKYPEISYPRLGKIFNRDHTTVMHACKKHGIPGRAMIHHTREYIGFATEMAKADASFKEEVKDENA